MGPSPELRLSWCVGAWVRAWNVVDSQWRLYNITKRHPALRHCKQRHVSLTITSLLRQYRSDRFPLFTPQYNMQFAILSYAVGHRRITISRTINLYSYTQLPVS